jgi:MYXO-CTERM domain-containing protein
MEFLQAVTNTSNADPPWWAFVLVGAVVAGFLGRRLREIGVDFRWRRRGR